MKINFIANVLGKGIWSLLAMLLLPVYVHYLGVEAYGIVGLGTALVAVSNVLDLGFTATLNRELARLDTSPDNAAEMRNLLRTTEVVYWSLAAMVGLAVVAASKSIAHGVHATHLHSVTVERALVLIGVATALQFPSSLYLGGLAGMQRQVSLNAALIAVAVVRGLAAVAVLKFVSQSVLTFLWVQVASNTLLTAIPALMLWHALPASGCRPSIETVLLKRLRTFLWSMAGVALLAAFLSQMDTFVVSRMLSLRLLGYYSIATAVATAPYMLSTAIYTTTLPRLTQLATLGDDERTAALYHRSCQLLSLVLLPVVVTGMLFSRTIVQAWTGNAVTADQTHLLVTIMLIGVALNGILAMPYALQIASNWPRISLVGGAVSVLVCLPLLIALTQRFGSVGAPFAWITMNIGLLLIAVPIMHRRLLKGEMRRWYIQDTGVPACCALAACALTRAALPAAHTRAGDVVVVLAALAATTVATLFAVPLIRDAVFSRARMLRIRFVGEVAG